MREYNIIKEINASIKWYNSTAMIEQEIDNAKAIMRKQRQADPTLLVMGQDVAYAVGRWMRAQGFRGDSTGGLGFYLYRHQLPPRFMDMKVLVIPVEFLFMFPELASDVWIVYEQDVVVLKWVIE